jgi:hypothetical protein
MKKLILSVGGATLAALALAATVVAADPTGTGRMGGGQASAAITTVLGLTREQIMDLRQDGLSLAQIAARQNVDVVKVIDALVGAWNTRIEAREAAGAISAQEAAQLESLARERVTEMVQSTTTGGMGGATVGAGYGRMGGGMMGSGNGTGAWNGGSCAGLDD